MATSDIPQWHAFLQQVRRDVFAARLSDMPGGLDPHVPFDYYAALYGHEPERAFDAVGQGVINRFASVNRVTRRRTVWRVHRFLRASNWLEKTIGTRVLSEPSLGYYPFAHAFDGHYATLLERLNARLKWVAVIEIDPARQAEAVSQSESMLMDWIFQSTSDSDAYDATVAIPEFDSLPLLRYAQRHYPAWLRQYRLLVRL